MNPAVIAARVLTMPMMNNQREKRHQIVSWRPIKSASVTTAAVQHVTGK